MKSPRLVLIECILIFAVVFLPETSAGVSPPDIHYDIRVSLDTAQKILTGEERIVYLSGSDEPLNELYMHLYANAYRGRYSTAGREAEQKLSDFTLAHARDKELGYCDIKSIEIDGQPVLYDIDDTSLRIHLPEPLAPGDSTIIDISFVTKIPRVRHRFCYKDEHYAGAQWYPKMAVYDANRWHTDRYHLIGEFYGDFASFDVSITLPQGYYVGATGYLVDAIGGDNDIPHISLPKDSVEATRRGINEAVRSGALGRTKTLVFHEDRVHDFAWVASPEYVKDNGEWNGITVTTLVFRGHTGGKWKHLMEYSLDALEFWSENIGTYPYSHMTVAEAYSHPNGGMEYPTLAMIDPGTNAPFTNVLDIVTAHEIGHNWWYGIVANDELNEPWLDEGFNEYYTVRYANRKYGNNGMYDLPFILDPVLRISYELEHETRYLGYVAKNQETVVDRPAFQLDDYFDYGTVVYIKGAFVLDMLAYVVGDSLFDSIIRTYYSRFQFKHPTTEDFIRVSEELSGQELNWFFEQWLKTSKTCDYALGKVGRSRPDQASEGYVTDIEIERRGEIVMPVEVELTLKNGDRTSQRLFADDTVEKVAFQTVSPVKKVIIDPEQRLLETNRLNNSSGFLPPLGFGGVARFGALSRTDRYTVMAVPSVAYNTVDKWKLGVSLVGGGPPERNCIAAGVAYGTDTEDLSYHVSYSSILSIHAASNGRYGLGYGDSNGMRNYTGFLSLSNRQPSFVGVNIAGLASYPVRIAVVSAEYSDKYDSRYFDSDWYSVGKTFVVSTRLGYADKGYHGVTSVRLNVSSGVDLLDTDYSFNKFFVRGSQGFRLFRTGGLNVNVGGRVGYVFGNPPLHEKLHIGGGVPASTVDPIGLLSTNYGAGLRGYQYEPILGEELYSANLELTSRPLQWKVFVPCLFFDIARVNGDKDSPFLNTALMDAGVAVSFAGVVDFVFPVWVSDPVDDDDSFEFRFSIGFDTGI